MDQRTKERRRPLVEQLAKQGYTQEAIAMQLGIGQKTVSRDLETLVTVTNVKGQGKDTLGRNKSTGRPKGSGARRRHKNSQTAEDLAASLVLDKGKTREQAASETGIGAMVVQLAVEREKGRREGPEVDPKTLSMTAQEKLDAAIRQYKRKLDLEFETRVLDEVKRRIDQIVLPHWKEKIAQAQELYARRRGAMDKATFNKIRRALHPDSRSSISDRMLGDAFDTFMNLEKFLLDEKDSPTDFSGLPNTWAEWEKAKRDAAAARRARRARGESSALRRA